jgi:hypothetical protein
MILTKSKFVQSVSCANKLHFKLRNLPSKNEENKFLEELASGGFQVEALARTGFQLGVFVGHESPLNIQQRIALRKKGEELQLFEPTFEVDGISAKVDILVVNDQGFHIKEVKAKSYDAQKAKWIGTKPANVLLKKYADILMDLAFQTEIIRTIYPDVLIASSFIMADKAKVATRDGLNQLFETDGSRILTTIEENLAWDLLIDLDMSETIARILDGTYTYQGKDFQTFVDLAKSIDDVTFPSAPPIQTECKNCEYRSTGTDSPHLICFNKLFDINDYNGEATILDIGNYKNTKIFDSGIVLLSDLESNPFEAPIKGNLLSGSNRQWLQFVMETNPSADPLYFDREVFNKLSCEWIWPLNLIDFETSAIAIPFFKGQHPYENVAFQFSHHILYEDGTIEHAGEFLNTTPGEFPNFQFARELVKSLSNNDGSVFRFAAHENTILTHIIEQLRNSDEVDKDDVIRGLLPLVNGNNLIGESSLVATRDMIDLLEVAKCCYYSKDLKGSYSMKKLLPAIFNTDFIKNKFELPINEINVTSINFPSDWQWYRDGKDPYKLLPTYEVDDYRLDSNTEINNGGLALAVYGKLQFSDVNQETRDKMRQGLLRYCELDTLAMAMVIQYFKSTN